MRGLFKARVDLFRLRPSRDWPTASAKRRADEPALYAGRDLAPEPARPAGRVRPRDVIDLGAASAWEQQQDRLDDVDEREWMCSWPGKVELPVDIEPDGSLDKSIDAVTAAKLVELINERILQPDASSARCRQPGHLVGQPARAVPRPRGEQHRGRQALGTRARQAYPLPRI